MTNDPDTGCCWTQPRNNANLISNSWRQTIALTNKLMMNASVVALGSQNLSLALSYSFFSVVFDSIKLIKRFPSRESLLSLSLQSTQPSEDRESCEWSPLVSVSGHKVASSICVHRWKSCVSLPQKLFVSAKSCIVWTAGIVCQLLLSWLCFERVLIWSLVACSHYWWSQPDAWI